jgi:hypothetical protein
MEPLSPAQISLAGELNLCSTHLSPCALELHRAVQELHAQVNVPQRAQVTQRPGPGILQQHLPRKLHPGQNSEVQVKLSFRRQDGGKQGLKCRQFCLPDSDPRRGFLQVGRLLLAQVSPELRPERQAAGEIDGLPLNEKLALI